MSDEVIERAEKLLAGCHVGFRLTSPARLYGNVIRDLIVSLKLVSTELEWRKYELETMDEMLIKLKDVVHQAFSLADINTRHGAPGDEYECPCSAVWVAKEAGPLDIRWELR